MNRQALLDAIAAIPVHWDVWKDGSIRDQYRRCPLCSLAHYRTEGRFIAMNLHEEAITAMGITVKADDMLAITGAADLPNSNVAVIKTTREQMLSMFTFRSPE